MKNRDLTVEQYYRCVRPKEAASILGVSQRTLGRLEKVGAIPPRRKLDPTPGHNGASVWRFGELINVGQPPDQGDKDDASTG